MKGKNLSLNFQLFHYFSLFSFFFMSSKRKAICTSFIKPTKKAKTAKSKKDGKEETDKESHKFLVREYPAFKLPVVTIESCTTHDLFASKKSTVFKVPSDPHVWSAFVKYLSKLQQNSPQWEYWRQFFFTGSQIPVIVGIVRNLIKTGFIDLYPMETAYLNRESKKLKSYDTVYGLTTPNSLRTFVKQLTNVMYPGIGEYLKLPQSEEESKNISSLPNLFAGWINESFAEQHLISARDHFITREGWKACKHMPGIGCKMFAKLKYALGCELLRSDVLSEIDGMKERASIVDESCHSDQLSVLTSILEELLSFVFMDAKIKYLTRECEEIINDIKERGIIAYPHAFYTANRIITLMTVSVDRKKELVCDLEDAFIRSRYVSCGGVTYEVRIIKLEEIHIYADNHALNVLQEFITSHINKKLQPERVYNGLIVGKGRIGLLRGAASNDSIFVNGDRVLPVEIKSKPQDTKKNKNAEATAYHVLVSTTPYGKMTKPKKGEPKLVKPAKPEYVKHLPQLAHEMGVLNSKDIILHTTSNNAMILKGFSRKHLQPHLDAIEDSLETFDEFQQKPENVCKLVTYLNDHIKEVVKETSRRRSEKASIEGQSGDEGETDTDTYNEEDFERWDMEDEDL